MLETLREYYNADRAYFYKFIDGTTTVESSYEVKIDGVVSALDSLNTVTGLYIKELIHTLSEKGTIYYKSIKDLNEKTDTKLDGIYSKYSVSSFIYGAIKDLNNTVIGFIGVDNPSVNKKNTELMTLLSRFIYYFVKNTKITQLQKESLLLEEESKVKILKKSMKNLRDFKNSTKKITEVLDSLRAHYGSNSTVVLTISEDRKTYSVIYESRDKSTLSRLTHLQNRPIGMIGKALDIFEKKQDSTIICFDDLALTSDERTLFEEYGMLKTLVSPMYDNNEVLTGLLSINNPTIENRSYTLVPIITKSISDYLEKIKMESTYNKKISLDPLTELYNKVATEEAISKLLNNEKTGVLFIIDVDYFKKLNDTLGHITGDQALIDVSRSLKKVFRKKDILGRIGGDEFMAFLPDSTTEELVIKKAKQICDSLYLSYEKDGITTKTSVSIGICFTSEDCCTFKQLYENADKALYQAKEKGKHTYSIFKEVK